MCACKGKFKPHCRGAKSPSEQAAGSLTFRGAVCYLSLGLRGAGLLSGGPSAAGLSFPSPFYSLAMLYDSASSEPHKSSPRKEAAAAAAAEEEEEKEGSEAQKTREGQEEGGGEKDAEEGRGKEERKVGRPGAAAPSSCEILPFLRRKRRKRGVRVGGLGEPGSEGGGGPLGS